MKPLIFIAIIASLIFISGCTTSQEDTGEPSELDAFAACLTENRVKMYGSITCSVCVRQRNLFGSSFQYVDEIECNAHAENSQIELCLEKGIQITPTWIREVNGEESRMEGYQTLENLANFSGCSLPISEEYV